MEKSIDLSNVPQKFGKCQWKESVDCTCDFTISIYMLKKMIELGLFSLEGGEEFA